MQEFLDANLIFPGIFLLIPHFCGKMHSETDSTAYSKTWLHRDRNTVTLRKHFGAISIH